MPLMDSTAKTAIAVDHAVAWFVFVDIVGDPIRITTFGADVVFSGTGDVNLDGNTFLAFDPRVIQIGEVGNAEGGSDTLQIDISAATGIAADLMSEIIDVTKWRGRLVRLWFRLYDPTGATAQGAIVAYYTGYASSVAVLPSAKSQVIRLSVENYLASFNQASNRNYLNQADYDAADISADATLAAANMGRGSATSGGSVPGDYGGIGGGGAVSGGVTGGGTGGGGIARSPNMPVHYQ